MSNTELVTWDMVDTMTSTYWRLLLSILAPCGLCAEVGPYTTVAATVDPPTAGCLCVEYGQFGNASLDAGDGRLFFGSRVSPHQALSIIAIVVVVVVRV